MWQHEHTQTTVAWEDIAIPQSVNQATPCTGYAWLQEKKPKGAGLREATHPSSLSLACTSPANKLLQACVLMAAPRMRRCQGFTANNSESQVLSVSLPYYKSLFQKVVLQEDKASVSIPSCLSLTLREMLGLNYVLPKFVY